MHTLAVALLSLPVVLVGGSHLSAQASIQADAVVHRLIADVLIRGEGHIGEVKTSTYVAPSPEDVAKIKVLGNSALNGLEQEMHSLAPFHQVLAARLLGEIGGPQIVPILQEGLSSSHQDVVRTQSLSSLRSAPAELAIPILQAATKDYDKRVADRAILILHEYYRLQ